MKVEVEEVEVEEVEVEEEVEKHTFHKRKRTSVRTV